MYENIFVACVVSLIASWVLLSHCLPVWLEISLVTFEVHRFVRKISYQQAVL